MIKNAHWAVLFFCCLAILSPPAAAQKKSLKTPPPVPRAVETLDRQINRISRRYGLDPRLFQALIYAESTNSIRAFSPKGAACYTQLMPATARRFGLRVDAQVDERYDPEKCLSAGAYYLSWLLATFRGDVRLALAGYNAGEGAVMQYRGRIPPYRETVLYVEKICNWYFGQAGHGIALAYNQPLAQGWVNAFYAAGGARRRAFPAAGLPAPESVPPPSTIAAGEENFLPDLKANDNKKAASVRVFVEDSAPRIRTQSLSFGNK